MQPIIEIASFAPPPDAATAHVLSTGKPRIVVKQGAPDLRGLKISDHAEGCPAIVVGLSTILDSRTLERMRPALRLISTFTAGVDNIDVEAARRLGISIYTTKKIVAAPTAEIAMLLILAVARNAAAGFQLVKSGNWKGVMATPLQGFALDGRTLGIVGFGSIGALVAARAQAFGMDVAYHNRAPSAQAQDMGARYCGTLRELLETSDIVSLHCPLTEETRSLINRESLSWLKPGAMLVNAARGELLDDDAVVEALEGDRLAGLGLDVYANEPRMHPAYLVSDKTFTLPHIGTGVPAVRGGMVASAYLTAQRFLSGDAVEDLFLDCRNSHPATGPIIL